MKTTIGIFVLVLTFLVTGFVESGKKETAIPKAEKRGSISKIDPDSINFGVRSNTIDTTLLALRTFMPPDSDDARNHWLQMERLFKIKCERMKKLTKLYSWCIPKHGVVLECSPIPGGKRELILWLPKENFSIAVDEIYTCPDYTSGSIVAEGPVFVTLVNSTSKRKLNSIQIDTVFDLPGIPITCLAQSHYPSAMGGKYFTEGGSRDVDGLVSVLKLEDHNGDGYSAEFPLFENFGCAFTNSTLFGYSRRKDKLIHYPIRFTNMFNKDSTHTSDSIEHYSGHWVPFLFVFKPGKAKRKFVVDFTGRGGLLERYQSQYDPSKERFRVSIDSRFMNGDDTLQPSWVPSAMEE